MWNPYAGAERYAVVRKNLNTGQENRWEVAATQFIDLDASEATSFAYTVGAILPGGAQAAVSDERRLIVAAALPPPKWIGAYQEQRSAKLAWDRVEGAAFYNVYRSESDGAPTLLVSIQDTKYVDTTTKAGVTYTYRLRAVGVDSRESKDSELQKLSVLTIDKGAAEAPAEQRVVEVIQSIGTDARYRLREPTDLVVSNGALFVTDQGSRSVLVLGPDGVLLYAFGLQPPEYVGAWGIPWGIGASPAGDRVAVTFMRSPNVRIFAREGKLIADFAVGRPDGYENRPEVAQPMDVAFDRDGSLWVSEYTYGQLVHLTAEGKEVGRVGVPRFAKEPGPFRSPTFLVTRPSGGVYAADSLLGEIFEVDAAGQIVRRWRQIKGDAGLLNLPKGLALLGADNLLVVDGLHSSLQSFGPEGKLQAVYHSKNKKFLDLTGLVSAAVDPKSGEIFVLSKVDSAIYRLRVTDAALAK